MKKEKNILVISGPTGSGESTVTKAIVERFPDFERMVTSTSREPRLREQHGIDYYFFSKEDFQKEIDKGNVPEHTYIANRDTFYGTYLPDLEERLKRGKKVIVNVDHKGLKYYEKEYGAISIFLDIESIDVIARRLKNRNPDMNASELERRLQNARDEIEMERAFYKYIVVNKDGALEETIDKIAGILDQEGYTS